MYNFATCSINLIVTIPTENNDSKTIEGIVSRVLVTNGRTKILLDNNQVFVI